MIIKSFALAGATVGTVASLGLIGMNHASAQTSGTTIRERIATTFNLDQTEVDQVFEEVRQEKQAERQAEVTTSLDAKVADGTISESAKAELLAILEEGQSAREASKDLDHDARHEAMEAQKQKLDDWATANNVELSDILPGKGNMGGGYGRHNGPRGHSESGEVL